MEVSHLILRLRRNALLVVFSMIPGYLIGFVYLVLSEPEYTAEAAIVLEANSGTNGTIDTLLMELDTHANLISSELVVAKVVDELGLHTHPEFRFDIGLVERLVDYSRLRLSQPIFGGVRHLDDLVQAREKEAERETEAFLVSAAAPKVRANLDVVRAGQSRVLRIAFVAGDAELAASVTNAFVRVYLDQPLSAGEAATGKLPEPQGAELENGPYATGDFRVVSWASVPSNPTKPNIGAVLTVFTMMGVIVGLMLAYARENGASPTR